MSLLPNINKKTLAIATTAAVVLFGGVGVSLALSAIPSSKNESPTTTVMRGETNNANGGNEAASQDLTNVPDTTLATNATTVVADVNSSTTNSADVPPAASINGAGGMSGDDGDEDHHEGFGDGDHDDGEHHDGNDHDGNDHEGGEDGDDD